MATRVSDQHLRIERQRGGSVCRQWNTCPHRTAQFKTVSKLMTIQSYSWGGAARARARRRASFPHFTTVTTDSCMSVGPGSPINLAGAGRLIIHREQGVGARNHRRRPRPLRLRPQHRVRARRRHLPGWCPFALLRLRPAPARRGRYGSEPLSISLLLSLMGHGGGGWRSAAPQAAADDDCA